MTNLNAIAPLSPVGSKWKTLAAAIGAALVFYIINFFSTKASYTGNFLFSTDDMVRMVIVRDWLAGQSWYDPVLHRLGFEPGTIMHWSRLIDAPIGLLIIIGNFFSPGEGEHFAAIVWPFITFVAALAGLLTAVKRATSSDNIIPSFIIGGFALWAWCTFNAGMIDHHNAQTALLMWLIASILPSEKNALNFSIAGVIVALMLSIGMESLPGAIAGAMAVLVRLIVEREVLYGAVRQFGLSLAIAITMLFFLLTGPLYYSATYCDSLSLFHLVCAGSGGILIYALLHPRIRQLLPFPYLSAPGIAGAVVIALAYTYFPLCLGDPTVGIDPVLKHYWLNQIGEAMNVFQVAKSDPWLLLYQHVLGVIAIATLVYQLTQTQCQLNLRLISGILLIFVVMTSAVTLFQIRGLQQSGPVTGLVLSIMATRFMEGTGKKKPILALGVLVVCCNYFWQVMVVSAMSFMDVEPGPMTRQPKAGSENLCRTPDDLAIITAEKPGLIAAANGLGPWLMFSTNHHVLAGPYHRNGEGNLASINIMTGSEEQAHALLKKAGATLFAACPEFVDEEQILKEAPDGFLGQLSGGKKVDWLEPIASTMDRPLKIWRVRG
jgi:hypothetical protein